MNGPDVSAHPDVDPQALLADYAATIHPEADYWNHGELAPKAFAALRAVLELHRPTHDGDACEECHRVGENIDRAMAALWPCDTVEAITTVLKAPD